MAHRRAECLLIEQTRRGQAGTSSLIENYLGFPSGVTGTDLAHRAARRGVSEPSAVGHSVVGIRRRSIPDRSTLRRQQPLVPRAGDRDGHGRARARVSGINAI